MATASIGGLASGLDTASIISQLMQLEALPQTQLKSRVTTEQTKLTALQSLNSRLAALATSADALAHPSGSTPSVWDGLKATSSNSAVTVTASSSAGPASYSVTIGHTAITHGISYTEAHAATDVVTGGATTIEPHPRGAGRRRVGRRCGVLTRGVRRDVLEGTRVRRLRIDVASVAATETRAEARAVVVAHLEPFDTASARAARLPTRRATARARDVRQVTVDAARHRGERERQEEEAHAAHDDVQLT